MVPSQVSIYVSLLAHGRELECHSRSIRDLAFRVGEIVVESQILFIRLAQSHQTLLIHVWAYPATIAKLASAPKGLDAIKKGEFVDRDTILFECFAVQNTATIGLRL